MSNKAPQGAQPDPGPAPKQTKSVDEQLASFDHVPLFMRDLPKESDDNLMIDALQALAFEGHPDDAAESFKKQGNEYFTAKRYSEALGFYRQALDAKPGSKTLLETIYLNSAACNLALRNYGRALYDSRDAIATNPSSIKALYRATKAFLALDRIKDAQDAVKLALERDPENAELAKLEKDVIERSTLLEQRETEAKERARRKHLDEEALRVGFLARGLWVENTPGADSPNVPHFDPDYISPNASSSIPLLGGKEVWRAPDPIRTPIIFPLVLAYPQHNTSDFIPEYQEDTPIGMHLNIMFPPESRGSLAWDPKGEYVAKDLSVIATTHKRRLLRVGHKLSLREAMDQAAKDTPSGNSEHRDGMLLLNGTVTLFVFPKGHETERRWVQEFKQGHVALGP
ncbi:HSP70/90 co-chaperone [Malassezia vespertilionis]|uniref:Cns1/TTC4 wheel domain-containing protein n=1 Tax=Malassezia vespertilionis TaxID=2020962 RepID=A0A2N1JCD1_9BASI|nr:HSP70/90 co-chaperone [Malassezia vespertilionis]PKI84220.1 hypothetical protein MVES_001544 [Malassezia vespertilionis]WFD06297.1 HSP70/90 co-chaperone [Malassezia vespertilionis]